MAPMPFEAGQGHGGHRHTARRKTTFLHQLRHERQERGIARERLPYVNFEDEQLVGRTEARKRWPGAPGYTPACACGQP